MTISLGGEKMNKKLFFKISACLAVVVFLFVGCSGGGGSSFTSSTATTTTITTTTTKKPVINYTNEEDFINGIMADIEKERSTASKSFLSVAYADDLPSIYSDTRYPVATNESPWSWIPETIDVLMPYLMESGENLGEAIAQHEADDINSVGSQSGLPALPTYNAIKYLVENANAKNNKTLGNQYNFIARRSFEYPNISGLKEVDTLIFYIDENADVFNNDNIFYEKVGLPPNSVMLIRQNSTSSTTHQMVYIFPSMYFKLERLAYGELNFTVNPDGAYSTIKAFTAEGTQSYDMYTSPYPNRSCVVPVTNNTINSIVDNYLTTYQNQYGHSSLLTYAGSDRPFTALEALVGLYFNSEYSIPFMGRLPIPTKWFVSAAFLNSNYNSFLQSNFSYDDNINPQLPPAYFVNNDNSIHYGSQLTTNNVEKYYDYGVTYNQDEDKFELDLDKLTAKINADIVPHFDATFKGVYENQPEIGMDFNSDLSLNLPDISNQLVNDLVINSGGGGGSSWEPPSYPAVNTSAFIPATYPTFTIQTIPPAYGEVMGETLSNGWDILDSLGIISLLVPFVIIILFWRFTGK